MGLVTDILLPISLAVIMASMGLALVPGDFARVVKAPRAFAVGAVGQILLLPLLAFALALAWLALFDPPPALAMGFVLLAACPGGVTSNLLTHLARGDTALSISLTAVISVSSVATIPMIVGLGLALIMGADAPPLSLGETVAGIFAITTVPVALGMAARHFRPETALRLEPAARKIAAGLFVLIVAGAVAAEWDLLVAHFADIGPPVLILNLAAMAMGALIARAARLARPREIAIALETGLQNGTLAIFVGITLIGDELMIVPAGVYSLIMFATAGAYVAWMVRSDCARATAR